MLGILTACKKPQRSRLGVLSRLLSGTGGMAGAAMVLACSMLVVPAAAFASDDGGFTLSEAEWEARKARLKVKGRGDPGVSVTVVNAFDTSQVIGSARVNRKHRWKVVDRNPSPVPCRVAASANGVEFGQRDVEDAPSNCAPKGPSGSNKPPTCAIDAPTGDVTLTVGESIDYTGTVTDPDADPVTIGWVFAGGTPSRSTQEDPGSVKYNSEGTFTTTLDATDSNGASCAQQVRTITVEARPTLPPIAEVSINSTSQNRPEGPPPVAVAEEPAPGASNSLNPAPGSGTMAFQIVAINDLGMHCGDLDTRIASILPPFNVLHAQVIRKGGEPDVLTEADGVDVVYSAASNPDDPVLSGAPLLSIAPDGGLYKTNFWDVVNIGAYDPFYPPNVTPLSIPEDLGLPVPDVERLYLGDQELHADQQAMPGIPGPYMLNDQQTFEQFIGTFPFFVNFPFGYTADVNWFEAAGIPVAFADDFGRENAYPLMRVQAVAGQGNRIGQPAGAVLASVDTVAPISAEADCWVCHAAPADGGNGTGTQRLSGGALWTSIDDPQDGPAGSVPGEISVEWASDRNLLALHDLKWGTTLTSAVDPETGTAAEPVVCQKCHYTPALDLAQVGPMGPESEFPADTDANGREQKTHETMSRVMHFVHGSYTDKNRPLFPEMPPFGQRTDQQTQDILEETCYRCHPGNRTQCLRGAMASAGLVCQDCHGDMQQVGDDFSRDVVVTNRTSDPAVEPVVSSTNPGGFILADDFYTNPETPRVPWANEPGCGSCHTGDALSNLAAAPDTLAASDGIRLVQAFRVGDPKATPIVPSNKRFAEDTIVAGASPAVAPDGNPKLYRVGIGGLDLDPAGETGHGELFCEACHGSTHAEWPNANPFANDNVTALQLQGHTGTVIECNTCHTGELGNTLEGPHGMHPVGASQFVNGGHEDMAEDNLGLCATCHGPQGEGTVLSVAKAERTGLEDAPDGTIAAGTEVGCGICHDNPFTEGGEHN